MLKINKTNFNSPQKNYYSTTGYSSFNKSTPFQQKSISKIQYENQLSKQAKRSIIETMYKSGNKYF